MIEKMTIELDLSAYNGAELTRMEKDGSTVKGIFIPTEPNAIYVDRHGKAISYLRIVTPKRRIVGKIYLLVQYWTRKMKTKLTPMGYSPAFVGCIQSMQEKNGSATLDMKEVLGHD